MGEAGRERGLLVSVREGFMEGFRERERDVMGGLVIGPLSSGGLWERERDVGTLYSGSNRPGLSPSPLAWELVCKTGSI